MNNPRRFSGTFAGAFNRLDLIEHIIYLVIVGRFDNINSPTDYEVKIPLRKNHVVYTAFKHFSQFTDQQTALRLTAARMMGEEQDDKERDD